MSPKSEWANTFVLIAALVEFELFSKDDFCSVWHISIDQGSDGRMMLSAKKQP